MKKNKINRKSPKKRKVKLSMSVELDVLMNNEQDEETQLNNIGKVYKSCFGDKDIKIDSIEFVD